MSINLLNTYEEMIRNDNSTQQQIDKTYNAIYMDRFIRPDLRINRRAGYKSNGDFVEGLHIYPDKESISEMLETVQNYLDKNINIINQSNNRLGTLLFISEIVNDAVSNYFGTHENISETDKVFHAGINDPKEWMANLSDFKNKNSAVCQEKALATFVLLSVICNNPELKKFYPYKPFMSTIGCCLDVGQDGYDGSHALCGLVSLSNDKEMYLLDSTNYGIVEDKQGNKKYVYGFYELSLEEIELMFNEGAIVPTLFRCKHLDDLTQLSHRAFSKDPRQFQNLHSTYSSGRQK